MAKECEIEVLDINAAAVSRRLRELGARFEGRYGFRRVEFMVNGKGSGTHSWMRVRTDGRKTTVTLKEIDGTSRMSPMVEHEMEASDFATAVRIMTRLARSRPFYFENTRRAYRLGKTYVTIDKWPRIPSFLEIEAPSMKDAMSLYRRMGVSGRFVGNIPIHKVYSSYGLDFRETMGKNDTKLKALLGQ